MVPDKEKKKHNTEQATLRKKLLRWFKKNGRAYPWRTTENWYHLLMAEMMLRRTRADQVLPVYRHFVQKFEKPIDAKNLSESAWEEMLRPLGLGWRARQMHETTDFLNQNLNGQSFDSTLNLREIPGVGPYSEGMLRSRLFREPRAAIDVNVARVLCRLHGWDVHPESRRKAEVIEKANALCKSSRAFEINLALLDLAALVCRARSPLCEECPLARECSEFNGHSEENLEKYI